jgi:preprotein translocase SecE subunit
MASQPVKKAKVRKVKNPETFREKAVKASIPKVKKKRFGFALKAIKKIARLIATPFRKFAKTRLGRILKKPLRLLGVVLLVPYFRGSFTELKLVTWPGWKQSRKLTYAVLSFAIVFGAAIAGLDWVLSKIFKEILIK